MTSHYTELGSAFDWLKQVSVAARPIRSTNLIQAVIRYQNGISVLVSQTSFRGETGVGFVRFHRFSQASDFRDRLYSMLNRISF